MGILATNTTFFHSVFKPLVRGVLGQGTEELTASLASGGEALMVFFTQSAVPSAFPPAWSPTWCQLTTRIAR